MSEPVAISRAAAAILCAVSFLSSGCAATCDRDLTCYLPPTSELPAGWRLIPKENIGCKTPFWTENPQVSDKIEFIEPLVQDIFHSSNVSSSVKLGLMAGYESNDDRDHEVLIAALLLDSEPAATQARMKLETILKADEAPLHVIRQNGKTVAVMICCPGDPGAEWATFKAHFRAR